MGHRVDPSTFLYQGPPYDSHPELRPCSYCSKTWLDKRSTYRSTSIAPSNYLTKVCQLNVSTKKTVWTWLCHTCLDDLKKEVDKHVDYMPTPEQNAAATIAILKKEHQEEEECLAAI